MVGASIRGQVLWTDDSVAALVPFLRNRMAFERAPNFGEKADVLRYELLYAFGGVYVDVDMQCVGTFERLVEVRGLLCRMGQRSAVLMQLIPADVLFLCWLVQHWHRRA